MKKGVKFLNQKIVVKMQMIKTIAFVGDGCPSGPGYYKGYCRQNGPYFGSVGLELSKVNCIACVQQDDDDDDQTV